MADLLVTPVSRSGKYIDFTVGNPAAPTYHDTTDPNVSSTVLVNSTNRARELVKLRKYSDVVGNIVTNGMFVPFSVESTGRIGERTMSYLLELFPCDARGFTKAVPLIKQIGMILAQYNARAAIYSSKRRVGATEGDG